MLILVKGLPLDWTGSHGLGDDLYTREPHQARALPDFGAHAGERRVVIIGAGPAGLTAAYELRKRDLECVVLEKDRIVGGLARTVNYKGFRFDIGGHRFFTKVRAVEDFWKMILPPDKFLLRKRLSRIYYNKRFFSYPIQIFDTVKGLGPYHSLLAVLSYLQSKMRPRVEPKNLEQYLCNHFGRHIYRIFFKTYTERVWGIPCDQISAEWGAQRIKGLSLLTALKNALFRQGARRGPNAVIKTLVDKFYYPQHGPGMMWEAATDAIRSKGGSVRLGTEVRAIRWSDSHIESVGIEVDGRSESVKGTDFISSMAIRDLLERFDPAPPTAVLEAARRLSYRDFLTVALVVDSADLFPDNWIYVHDPQVQVCRIQNFKNWSPAMVPDPAKTCLGLEYFCFEGDGLWNMDDAGLIALATRELRSLRFARADQVVDGCVVRAPKAYPVYDPHYEPALSFVRGFLDRFQNLQLIGRNGMHKYNNQDHSMLTAMLAVRNICGGQHDLWRVNAEEAYHEEIAAGEVDEAIILSELAGTQPRVPSRAAPATG